MNEEEEDHAEAEDQLVKTLCCLYEALVLTPVSQTAGIVVYAFSHVKHKDENFKASLAIHGV